MDVKITGLETILNMLDSINSKVDSMQQPTVDKWLDNEEFIVYLKISKKTAQHYRDNGLIEFSQIGAKIYYKLSEVNHFLELHTNKKFGRSKHTQ
ncbi:helix-turn-helix domain-containing protein [uncultured Mucilaginibacter sp.]|uniref:helix-turn-helix domain-containing protein n=1 Tax=uncultured Mucilaginibacter sp. TaxID=797541 RepID=UPI0025F38C59|nr:helix-turn-helix domain-containing protein [uncultured Mucilaginibacter sp.]